MPTPFLIFSWQRPFLKDLQSVLVAQPSGIAKKTPVVIVPNDRPSRYLVEEYREAAYAGLLPRVMPLEKMVSLWALDASPEPPAKASLLDRIALLRECISALSGTNDDLAEQFSSMETAQFMPWGIRLARLMDELFRHDTPNRSILYPGDEVNPIAGALLASLDNIRQAYTAILKARGRTTPGLNYQRALSQRSSIPPSLNPAEQPVFIAGFSSLDAVEEALLKELWLAGATVCLHTDPALAKEPAKGHPISAIHVKWMQRWHAYAEPALEPEAFSDAASQTFFFSGYDYHSQLLCLKEDLAQTARDDAGGTAAVILTDDSLLMPALRCLPGDRGVNISLGYPMRRTSLARLVRSILALQRRKADDGRCYWRDLQHCLRHPYIRMLTVKNEKGERHFLKDSICRLEKALVDAGERYIDIEARADDLRKGKNQEAHADEALAALLLILASISGADRLSSLAKGIESLCDFLLSIGGDAWTAFPLDAEILNRFLQDIVPELKHNCLADEVFPPASLAVVCDSLMREERIPFEAFPLTGLQVLGMLETRLLHFDHIFILDATDDKLPGNPPQDSLLPDSLRTELGLPDAREQRERAAYNLHRLCAGAKSVHFYWQEGISHSSLFDGKKSRTRFVEELLWRHEQDAAGKDVIRTAKCLMGDIRRGEPKAIPIGEELRSELNDFLKNPISPTALDAYLSCPLSFAWKNLFHLKAPGQICEGDDPAAVGNCIHAALESLYSPRIGKSVSPSDFSDEDMASALAEAMKAHAGHLPADSAIMLETMAPKRLRQFFKRQPESTEIVALEDPFPEQLLTGSNDHIRLRGRMDRIDRREGQLYVLDYKTGSCRDKLPREKDFWRDMDFFERLGDAHIRGSSDPQSLEIKDALFKELRERLPSLQLPCYITLLKNDERGEAGNACLVELYDTGAELPLFKDLDESETKAARDACELILRFVIGHMRSARSFRAVTGPACRYCSFADLCSVRTETPAPE